MGKTILVLGAGFVAKPCVQYLLRKPENRVLVADQSGDQVERVLEGNVRGRGIVGDVSDSLGTWIDGLKPDLVVTLLPKPFFLQVARTCTERGVNFILPTTATPEVVGIKDEIARAGVTAIAELGVDPGIDHMIAMRSVSDIRRRGGGSVVSFWSVCGSLPAPESNTNPIGYKVSWAPNHVVYAGNRDALFLRDSQKIFYPGGETFEHFDFVQIEGTGWFECYADGCALPYAELYGIDETTTIFRGTLRYPGWCELYVAVRKLGFFDDEKLDVSGKTLAGLLADRTGFGKDSLRTDVTALLGVPSYSTLLPKLEWLGLFDDTRILSGEKSLSDILCGLLVEKLVYRPGEKDLVALVQKIGYRDETGREHIKTSSLVIEGNIDEETAIAKTTGLPIAMGAELVLQGRFNAPGLHIPVLPEIYEPILEMLQEEGVVIREELHRVHA